MLTPVAPLVTVIINTIPFSLLFSSTDQVKKKRNPDTPHKSLNSETFNINTVIISNVLTPEIEGNPFLRLPVC